MSIGSGQVDRHPSFSLSSFLFIYYFLIICLHQDLVLTYESHFELHPKFHHTKFVYVACDLGGIFESWWVTLCTTKETSHIWYNFVDILNYILSTSSSNLLLSLEFHFIPSRITFIILKSKYKNQAFRDKNGLFLVSLMTFQFLTIIDQTCIITILELLKMLLRLYFKRIIQWKMQEPNDELCLKH